MCLTLLLCFCGCTFVLCSLLFPKSPTEIDLLLFAHVHALLNVKAPDMKLAKSVPENISRLERAVYGLLQA